MNIPQADHEVEVRECMSTDVLTVGPGHTLRRAAQLMSARGVGAAVVIDPEAPGIGMIAERDLMRAVANGENLDVAVVRDHMSSDLIYAAPDWTLEEAAAAMAERNFRHLVVLGDGEAQGILSMRDVVSCQIRLASPA